MKVKVDEQRRLHAIIEVVNHFILDRIFLSHSRRDEVARQVAGLPSVTRSAQLLGSRKKVYKIDRVLLPQFYLNKGPKKWVLMDFDFFFLKIFSEVIFMKFDFKL